MIEHPRENAPACRVESTPPGGVATTSARSASGLAAGGTLGRYRVERELGSGGMGTVYLAYDTQLRRPVALKVLLPEHTADPHGRGCLLREARAASALSHPNVVSIYEVASEAGLDFIAMEFVDGEPLGRMIPARGLPVRQTLDYAAQIAGGLAKAHESDIVHGDLKPGNVMVTRDGLVKLLDFGLARRVSAESGDTTLTMAGQIAGTPSYMSPEQAQGKPVDARTDIFSFGAVLYEMLTGRGAFSRGSAAETLSAVLYEEPPTLTGVPPELEKLVGRCLRKDPARRARHMDDVKLAIEELQEEPPAKPEAARSPTWARPWTWAATLAVVASIAGLALLLRARLAAPAPAPQRVVALTTYPGTENSAAFSPDGNQVAFTWNGERQDNFDIYIKVVGSEAPPLRLTSDPAVDGSPAWSPEGRQIAFLRFTGRQSGIYLVSALGGPEKKLAEWRAPAAASLGWTPDGKWLAVSDQDAAGGTGISLVPVGPGDPRRLTWSPAYSEHPSLAFSPEGRRLAYAVCVDAFTCDVNLLDLDAGYFPKGPPRRVTRKGLYIQGIAWAVDGRSLVFSAAQDTSIAPYLWRLPLAGDAVPERIELAGPEAVRPAFSKSGDRLAFSRFQWDVDMWRLDGGRPPERFMSSTVWDYNPEFAPDGTKIVFSSNRSGAMEIWTCERDGSKPVQLTEGPGKHQGSPRWSPDGNRIAFDSQGADGHWTIHVVDATGGRPRRLTPSVFDAHMPAWSRDGRWIYFAANRTGRYEIWRVSASGGESTRITGNGGTVPSEAWDGKTLYYSKTGYRFDPPDAHLFARPLSGGAERIVLDSVANGAFFVASNGIYSVSRQPAGGYSLQFFDTATGKTKVLSKIDVIPYWRLAVSPDRKTILFGASQPVGADLMMIPNFR